MKLIAYQKTIFCLALLLCWGICVPLVTAQGGQDSGWIDLSAPVQTVVVQTPRGNYSAVFQNQVRVYPNGSASGVLELSQRDGVLRRFLVFAGRVQFRDGIVIRVLLRTSEADTRGTTQGDPDIPIIIASVPNAGEDRLIYTMVGTDLHVATWEAQGRIVPVFRD
jgi:hypothetical protein